MSTFSLLQILQNELPIGEEKLQKALQQGEKTCAIAEPEDKEVIEEEVALLQEEFDNYADSLAKTKTLLEVTDCPCSFCNLMIKSSHGITMYSIFHMYCIFHSLVKCNNRF